MSSPQNRSLESFFLTVIGFICVLIFAGYILLPSIKPAFYRDQVDRQPDRSPSSKGESIQASDATNSNRNRVSRVDRPHRLTSAPSQLPPLDNAGKVAPTSLPVDVTETLDQAIKLVDSGQWQEAEKLLLKILMSDPNHESALVELAMINLLDKKDPNQALPFIKQALRVNADNESLIAELLTIYEDKGRTDEAAQFFRQLRDEYGESQALDYGLAQALIRSGRKQEAIEFLERSVENRDGFDKDEALDKLGDTYADTGQMNLALESWRQAIERQKSHLEAVPEDKEFLREQYMGLRLKYASALMEQGRYDLVEPLLLDLEKEHPNDDWVVSMRQAFNKKRL